MALGRGRERRLERLMSIELDRAVLIALREELLGVLADLADLVESISRRAGGTSTLRTTTAGDIEYGSHRPLGAGFGRLVRPTGSPDWSGRPESD